MQKEKKLRPVKLRAANEYAKTGSYTNLTKEEEDDW